MPTAKNNETHGIIFAFSHDGGIKDESCWNKRYAHKMDRSSINKQDNLQIRCLVSSVFRQNIDIISEKFILSRLKSVKIAAFLENEEWI